jgi:hypothetical protein
MRRRGSELGWGVAALALGSACGSRTGLEGFAASSGDGVAPADAVLSCPTNSSDPRVTGFSAGVMRSLDVVDFALGQVSSTRWTVHLDDCDAVLPTPSFVTEGTDEGELLLTPGRPGTYRLTLEVNAGTARADQCDFDVPVAGRGLRVDLCWDTSTSVDLDLYVHTPLNQNPYYDTNASLVPLELIAALTSDTCNPANCTAFPSGFLPVFGYEDSPLDFCAAGPSANDFLGSGRCPNPRSGRDNNQEESTGTAEIVQIDSPRFGEQLRVMVQNFDNLPARPQVFVYCGGERQAALELPGAPEGFVTDQLPLPGVLWRVVDITPGEGPGGILRCSVAPLEHPEAPGAPFVTVNDVSY